MVPSPIPSVVFLCIPLPCLPLAPFLPSFISRYLPLSLSVFPFLYHLIPRCPRLNSTLVEDVLRFNLTFTASSLPSVLRYINSYTPCSHFLSFIAYYLFSVFVVRLDIPSMHACFFPSINSLALLSFLQICSPQSFSSSLIPCTVSHLDRSFLHGAVVSEMIYAHMMCLLFQLDYNCLLPSGQAFCVVLLLRDHLLKYCSLYIIEVSE